VAEAVTGELRKIGVRATLAKLTFAAYRQKQRDGKIQILVGHWSSGGLPDVSSTMNYYFGGGPRDYWRDETINKLTDAGEVEMDPERRMAIYQQVFDRANAMHYIMPLATHPSVFVHTAEVRVEKGTLIPSGAEVNRIHWK
jgi:peptide/nickel transport system substrate-binding protein